MGKAAANTQLDRGEGLLRQCGALVERSNSFNVGIRTSVVGNGSARRVHLLGGVGR